MKPKPKICQACGAEYMPFNSLRNPEACSIPCAIKVAKEKARKAAYEPIRREARKARKKMKSRSDWTREAQAECNKYIRTRDAGQPCISCGRATGAKMNAGHYLSRGAHPELRFHPLNIHLQCEHCNTHLSGNQIRYRARLIEKIGQEAVDWLEGPHEAQNWSIEDLKEIKDFYREQIKLIENN